jgi:transposase
MSCNPNKSKRYTDSFKRQIVELIKNGKSVKDVSVEYNIARSTVSKWYKDFTLSGSFHAKDNEDPKDGEIKHLRKELTYAKMEIDILKQAALIMGRK